MTQARTMDKLRRKHWRSLEKFYADAYQEGVAHGLARAHGQRRRGRTVRDDATVEGLVRLITRHFGLGRYGFELRVVHPASGRRLPAADPIRRYRLRD